MIFAATLLWSVEVVLAKRLLGRVDPLVVGVGRLGIGLIVLVGYLGLTGKLTLVGSRWFPVDLGRSHRGAPGRLRGHVVQRVESGSGDGGHQRPRPCRTDHRACSMSRSTVEFLGYAPRRLWPRRTIGALVVVVALALRRPAGSRAQSRPPERRDGCRPGPLRALCVRPQPAGLLRPTTPRNSWRGESRDGDKSALRRQADSSRAPTHTCS